RNGQRGAHGAQTCPIAADRPDHQPVPFLPGQDAENGVGDFFHPWLEPDASEESGDENRGKDSGNDQQIAQRGSGGNVPREKRGEQQRQEQQRQHADTALKQRNDDDLGAASLLVFRNVIQAREVAPGGTRKKDREKETDQGDL